MALKGDFATLSKMRKALAKVPQTPTRAAQTSAPELEASTRAGWDTQSDPSGKPWKQDKGVTMKLGTKSILYRSGAMLASVRGYYEGAKSIVEIGVEYVKYHFSTGRSPLPKKSGRLPKPWNLIVKAEVEKTIKDLLAGK